MPATPATASFNEALLRMGGMYGSAWRGGIQLAEAVEVSAPTEINRVEVQLVGSPDTGYKPGRVTREGTITIQKMDAKWEKEVWDFLSGGVAARRAARDAGQPTIVPFSLLLEIDDPDAIGIEKWQLDGCMLWRLPLGIAITDDLINREFPLTWTKETPIYAFERGTGPGGIPKATWYKGFGPPVST